MLQILVAEFWAKWLGIELNDNKRELPQTQTRHLGFHIDLRGKMLAITQKHKRKVVAHFNNILALLRAGRGIPCRTIQRLLGLQI